jgi:Trehalase
MRNIFFWIIIFLPFLAAKGELFPPDFAISNEIIFKKIPQQNFKEFSAFFDFKVPQNTKENSSISFVLGQRGKMEKYYLMAVYGRGKGELRIVRKWLREKTLNSRPFSFTENENYRFEIYFLGYKAFLKISSINKPEVLWDLGAILPFKFDFNQAAIRVFGDAPKMISQINYDFEEGQDLPKKGGYFKKERNLSPPPTYAKLRDILPFPRIEGLPNIGRMNDFTWQTFTQNFKKVDSRNEIFISPYIDEAFSPAIFQWDTIFMLFFAKYLYPKFNAINSLDNFYAAQTREGKILRVLLEKSGLPEKGSFFNYGVNPPLFSWVEVEWAEYTGDFSRYSKVFPVLEQYAHWLEISRRAQNTSYQLYWNSGLGSGMDNIPIETSKEHAWVDMSAQMVLMYKNLAKMAGFLNKTEKEKYYLSMANEIGERINRFMWNEKEGMYFCINPEGEHIPVWQIGAFWPILAGITNDSQNKKLIKHLLDPKLFWTDFPFPALAKNHPEFNSLGGYWKGGVWAPTNYMILLALNKIGEYKLAFDISQKMFNLVSEVFQNTQTIWEAYAPEFVADSPQFASGIKTDTVRRDFIGWSGLYPTTILMEEVLGIKVSSLKKTVTWKLFLKQNHGIKNISIGNGKLDLFRDGKSIRIYGTDLPKGWKLKIGPKQNLEVDLVNGFNLYKYN